MSGNLKISSLLAQREEKNIRARRKRMEGNIYFALAFSGAMLPRRAIIVVVKTEMNLEELKKEMEEKIKGGVKINYILNPSHKATIQVLQKWEIPVEIPQTPSRVELSARDVLYLVQVTGLPRLTDRHEYTSEEINRAEWRFMKLEIF